MKLWKKPVIVSTVVAVALSGALLSNTSFAASAKKQLEVAYNNIKVKYNNQEVAIDSSLEPFMVNGTTFIPLRAMGNVFGKQVSWDSVNKVVNVADATAADGTTIAELQSQITAKDTRINSLLVEIQVLKQELADAEEVTEVYDLDSMESDLNDDFEDYKDTDATITLKGDEDDVIVKVYVDPKKWANNLTSAKQEIYLQNIVNEILEKYGDADIEGTVVSDEDADVLVSFTVDNSGNVDVDSEGSDIDDLQDNLNEDYGDYQNGDFTFTLSGDEDDITIKVYVTETDWADLSSSKQNALISNLTGDIEDAFSGVDITGYIINSKNNSRIDTF